MPEKATREDIMADIQRVADAVGHPPTRDEYRERGNWSARTAANRFDGSFTAARAAALDVPDERRPEIPRDELLADIERVAEIVGGEPSKGEYKEHGEYALSGVTYRFASWVAAKKEAGVYEGLDDGPAQAELIEDLRRVDREHSGPVTQVTYQEHGDWSKTTIQRWFDSWEDACQQAGVTRPEKGPRTEDTAALIADIQRVAGELGHAPSRSEYHEMGEFSRQMAKDRLGSWPEAVRRAGYEPREPGPQPGELNPNWKGGYGDYYGQNWHEQRRRARERDGRECAVCGMSEREHLSEFGWGLEVHHIVPVREFDAPEDANDLENLITLCRTHHREYEQLPAERAKELVA